MVASFPEFDYTKNRSNKGGCVPSAQKPSRLTRTLHSKSSAHSTIIGKILSFHGSFNYSNQSNIRQGTQISGLGNSASKLKGTTTSGPSSADVESNVGSPHFDSGNCNAASKDDTSASKIGRKWSSSESTSSHLSTMGLQESNSGAAAAQDDDLLQAGCDPPGKHAGATKMGNLASKMGKACSSQSSVISQLSGSGDQDGEFDFHKCDQVEVDDYAHTLKRCSTLEGDSHNKHDNVGTQKFNSIDVGAKFVAQSSVGGSEVRNSNSAFQSKPSSCEASSNGVCNVSKQANAAQTKENLHKVSSSSLGVPNFSGENPLYASDNSSNNMRWSSTSCASTDTSSSNSTRRSSCESRSFIPSAAPPAFLAKPHKAHDAAWAAIRSLQLRQGGTPLAITHFNLIRCVGHGDIGSVFLAHLKDKLVASRSDASCLFAIKVMDKDALSQRNKLQRMHMEKEILECLDYPFLPTLYAHFDSEHFSCLVMDFCPGGDLYALRQKQPGKRFGLIAARFYAAEVLLALEYLHMLGIVYRDLKPENVLVREDGHIMLTDFDLSLKCDVQPELVKHPLLSSASLSNSSSKRRLLRSYSQSSTISSSSTTSFLHHESSNCRLPAACSIDPIISCLTLTNNAGKRAPQIPKQQSPIGFSMLSSKVSKVSHARTSDHKDGSVSEPLKISKQDVLCSEPPASISKDVDGREAARGAKMHSRSMNASRAHHDESRTELSKESHDSPSVGHWRAQKSHGAGERALTSDSGCQEDDHLMFMELVAEPTEARSMSFVGTHEYLAPEIIAGYGHGSPVDWWTFGIFLYELLYGRSPFKGASNDQTLINIIRKNLRFPETGAEIEGIEDARSLIEGLLMKDPRGRLGCRKGAAEIKQHAFFKGVNWALIRCTQPPEVPSPCKKGMHASSNHHHNVYHHHHHHYHPSKSLHQFDYF